jgi:Ni2+-binding GTPase involved in maturation of urease and hydrogenase
MHTPARYIMIGGFLGAGKTTAVSKLAAHLTARGKRVGLITNDQGRELVDTKMLRSQGFATEEIPGGCFCCRFNSLVEAAGRLTAGSQPDVFIAEPVGSCTDLVATVTYPLRRMYGDNFSIAPVSVLVDPIRAQRVLGLADGGNFSSKVMYIYRKQLEEADEILINKADLLTPEALDELKEALAREFPAARVRHVSCRTGEGLDEWFAALEQGSHAGRATMEVDYDVYAEGEALLGWLNATVRVKAPDGVVADTLLECLATTLHEGLREAGAEVAHLKMTLSPDGSLSGEIASVNLVRNDFVPELSQRLDDDIEGAQIIVNLRAEAAPEALEKHLRAAVKEVAVAMETAGLRIEHLEYFRPGRPVPTHRDVVVAD